MPPVRVVIRGTFEATWDADPADFDEPLADVIEAARKEPEDWATTTLIEDGTLTDFSIEVSDD